MCKKNNISIVMKSAQKFDALKDSMEIYADGTVCEKDGVFYIEYFEMTDSEQSALAGGYNERTKEQSETRTVIQIKKDGTVEVNRYGILANCYKLCKDKRNLCRYSTPYGEIMLGFTGREIYHEQKDGEGKLYLRYDLDSNGTLASENEIDLKYTVLEN